MSMVIIFLSLDKSTEDSGELREKDEEEENWRYGEDQNGPEGQTPPIPEKVFGS